ncbi:MAG: methyltransferase domain-containing protein [Polycyclovorans sp.]|jgi:arsenite methyltransferase
MADDFSARTSDDSLLDEVRRYYGEQLKSSADLQTNACCLGSAPAPWIQALLREIHPEVLERFYGCGSPIPPALEGCTVLDLGSGSGRDVYLMAQLVGPQGRVIGLDMTAEQLAVARQHQAWHAEHRGHDNVEFVEGFIEDLSFLPDASVDVITSNCVINLSPAKERVFAECLRVLKPGGELYFSDVFADRRISPALQADPLLRGECLSGALYTEDFRRLMARLGVADWRVASRSPISIANPAIEAALAGIRFDSVTVRAFKLALEDRCEDYGQVALYRGGIPQHEVIFELDDHHRFERGRPMLVCGNTADMLMRSRYGAFFDVQGDTSRHFGLFDCAPAASTAPAAAPGACC